MAQTIDPTFTKITSGPVVTQGSFAETCSWGDLDGDGRIDLFVTRSGVQGGPNVMYHNQGDGSFLSINNAVTQAGVGRSVGAAWADFDNDGNLDLLVGDCCGGVDRLFSNDGGGIFTQLPPTSFPLDSTSTRTVAWADYDLDGYVDFFMSSEGGESRLYQNQTDGTFKRVLNAGIDLTPRQAVGCSWSDYDDDGYPDLFLACFRPELNHLYRNNRDGSFSLVTTELPALEDGWGSAWGDYDNDGRPDLYITQFLAEDVSGSLYHNEGAGTFAEVSTSAVVTVEARQLFGGIWGDYDNDGYLDLFVSAIGQDATGANNLLFHNNRQGDFTQVLTGSLVNDQGASTGSAWGDYDNDGFLDLVVINWYAGAHNFLYRNNGNDNRWLILKLIGTVSNRAAIGAKARVYATIWEKAFWQLREILGGSGYGSQNDLRAHFGLGDATKVDTLRIEWPSGTVQELTDVPANQILTVTEPPRLIPQAAGKFQIQCWINQSFDVQASTDLTTWSDVATVTNTTGTLVFEDTEAAQQECRYYRAVAE